MLDTSLDLNLNKEIQFAAKDFSSWLEIDLGALENNYLNIKKIVGKDTSILSIVKADSYGHGALQICRKLKTLGEDFVAVATLTEALHLINNNIDLKILILLSGLPSQAQTIVNQGLIQTVTGYDMALALSQEAVKQDKNCKIHVKIDTGMGRLGFFPDEAVENIKKIKALERIEIEGIYTHFSSSLIEDKDYTMMQWEKFNHIIKKLEKNKIHIKYKHTSNSASIVDAPFMKLNMIRPGLALYGLYPNEKFKNIISLKPLLSLKAKIISVKEFKEASSISYNRTYTAPKGSLLAVVPVGYADGYTRRLSHNTSVLIKGKKYPVVGNICMDQIIVDITGAKNITLGDEVILMGVSRAKEISVDEAAQKTNTINYEILCHISKRLPKIYIDNGKIVNIEKIY